MIKIIKRWLSVKDYQTLIKNSSSLGLVQLSNYILPLITLPYLSRILGVEYFGLVMMAQSMMIYLTLFTDYGFNLSATKKIATHQNNDAEVSTIFSSVLIVKSILLLISALVLATLISIIPIFNNHSSLFILSFLIVIGNTFLPSFLFQGLEKMTFIALFNLIAKVSFTALIFFLIQSKNDYYFVHALWGLSYIIVNIGCFYIIKTKLNIKFSFQPWATIRQYFNLSFEYFLSRIAIAIYFNANIIIIGLLINPMSAGHYSGAEKLLFAITTFYAPIIETIYPYMSRSKNIQFVKKLCIITTSINSLGCMIAFFLAPIIIPLIFGSSFNDSVIIFQWMLIIAILHLPISIIGYPILGALGYEKTANRSAIIGACVHVLLILLTYQILTSPIQFVWIMIASQTVIFLMRVIKLFTIKKELT